MLVPWVQLPEYPSSFSQARLAPARSGGSPPARADIPTPPAGGEILGAKIDTEGSFAKRYHRWYYLMGKIRRGGFVFVTWKGDHPPRQVHVFRDGRLMAKWDLERGRLISGYASKRIRRLMAELKEEDLL